MNKIKGLFLILLLILSIFSIPGCEETVQTPDGLDANRTPETSTMFRVPLETAVPGLDFIVGDDEGKEKAEKNRKILKTTVSSIVKDVFAGEFPLYDPEYGTKINPEEPFRMITGIDEKKNPVLNNAAGYEEGLDALSNTFEVQYGYYKTPTGGKRTVEAIRLVWRDPAGKFPEKNFGIVHLADLIKKEYSVEVGGKSIDLITYLNEGEAEMFPISLNHGTDQQTGVKSMEQAYLEMKKLDEGSF